MTVLAISRNTSLLQMSSVCVCVSVSVCVCVIWEGYGHRELLVMGGESVKEQMRILDQGVRKLGVARGVAIL